MALSSMPEMPYVHPRPERRSGDSILW
jgi:hypothetical protein